MTCFYCKGSIENKLTNFIADLGSTIIIVKDVPSEVCTQCGEVSFSDKAAKRLEQIIAVQWSFLILIPPLLFLAFFNFPIFPTHFLFIYISII